MTPADFAVGPATPAFQVIQDMLAHKVRHLYIVDADGVLIGTISAMDVLRRLRTR